MKFTSDRKRMSVLVTDEEDDQYKLYMKGADSEILKRLSSEQDPNEIIKVKNFMHQASLVGFWVLLLAYRVISKEEFEDIWEWILEIEATSNIHVKNTLLSQIYDEIEWNMFLLGGTSVEDWL